MAVSARPIFVIKPTRRLRMILRLFPTIMRYTTSMGASTPFLFFNLWVLAFLCICYLTAVLEFAHTFRSRYFLLQRIKQAILFFRCQRFLSSRCKGCNFSLIGIYGYLALSCIMLGGGIKGLDAPGWNIYFFLEGHAFRNDNFFNIAILVLYNISHLRFT